MNDTTAGLRVVRRWRVFGTEYAWLRCDCGVRARIVIRRRVAHGDSLIGVVVASHNHH
jgi:hypothetical protein